MPSHLPAGMAALALVVSVVGGCNSLITGPDTTSAPPDAVVVEILGMNGDFSFSPGSMTVPIGRTVVWHNSDFNTHRIALDAGGLDTGDIRPGRFSPPMTITNAGPYHCTIHPSMIGALRRAEAPLAVAKNADLFSGRRIAMSVTVCRSIRGPG